MSQKYLYLLGFKTNFVGFTAQKEDFTKLKNDPYFVKFKCK